MNIQSGINKTILALEVTDRRSAAAHVCALLSNEGVKGSFDLADAFCRNGKILTKEDCQNKVDRYLKK